MDALETARQYLPSWAGWLSLIAIPISMGVTLVTVWITSWFALRPVKHLDGSNHWTYQAAVLFPAQRAAGRAFFFLPILCGLVAGLWYATPFSILSAGNLGVVVAGCVCLVGLLPSVWTSRRVMAVKTASAAFRKSQEGEERDEEELSNDLEDGERPKGEAVQEHQPGLWETLKSIVVSLFFTFVVLGPHVLLGLLVIAAFPSQLGVEHTLVTGFGALLLLIALKGGSTRLATLLKIAVPADERLSKIVEETRAKMEIEAEVKTFATRMGTANAYALPFARQMLFTQGILDNLTDEELRAICAHELGHITESRRVLFKRFWVLFTTYLFLSFVVPVSVQFGPLAAAALVVLFVVPIVFLQKVGREMEERADGIGLAHEGEEGTYARALEKLYQVNLMPAVLNAKNTTHPHLYDRLLQAGVEPSYLRPQPPSKSQNVLNLLVMIFCFLVLQLCSLTFVLFIPGSLSEPHSTHFSLALDQEPSWELTDLALKHFARGDAEGARDLYRASVALKSNPYSHANLSITHVHLRECDEARKHAEIAASLLEKDAKPEVIDLVSDASAVSQACVPHTGTTPSP